uniref:DNA adenine methylase n=1 Tax=Streptococcus pluranimalium TaxID=82348 RepID=UPI003F690BB3
MLILDEKKIRKGKPIGLPYQGSKKKICKKIIEIIKQNFGTDKVIYDIFGGGGAITVECLLNGLDVRYNDFDKDVTDMFRRVISNDREWLKTLLVSRDEFFVIKNKSEKTVDDNIKLLINSFGNNKKYYLYGKEHADSKHDLAKEIVEKHDVFSGYKQTQTWKKQYRELERLQQLEQLEQLQRLEQLERLEATNLDYKAFSDIEGAIFYLDPPYENTYQNYKGDTFDSQSFYDWVYQMSKRNTVLISSYEISDPRFEVAYEFKTARSTFQSGNAGKRYEKLFMAK